MEPEPWETAIPEPEPASPEILEQEQEPEPVPITLEQVPRLHQAHVDRGVPGQPGG